MEKFTLAAFAAIVAAGIATAVAIAVSELERKRRTAKTKVKVYVGEDETEAYGRRVDDVFLTLDAALGKMRTEFEHHVSSGAGRRKDVRWLSGNGGKWGWWDDNLQFGYYVTGKEVAED